MFTFNFLIYYFPFASYTFDSWTASCVWFDNNWNILMMGYSKKQHITIHCHHVMQSATVFTFKLPFSLFLTSMSIVLNHNSNVFLLIVSYLHKLHLSIHCLSHKYFHLRKYVKFLQQRYSFGLQITRFYRRWFQLRHLLEKFDDLLNYINITLLLMSILFQNDWCRDMIFAFSP